MSRKRLTSATIAAGESFAHVILHVRGHWAAQLVGVVE